jgi:BRCT domain type II-containing protein
VIPRALFLVVALSCGALAQIKVGGQEITIPGAPAAEKKEKTTERRELRVPVIKRAGGKKKGKAEKENPHPNKYKFTGLADATEHTYRFDAAGKPIAPKAKKAAAKKKSSSEPPAEDADADKACSAEAPCAAKSSDADAL